MNKKYFAACFLLIASLIIVGAVKARPYGTPEQEREWKKEDRGYEKLQETKDRVRLREEKIKELQKAKILEKKKLEEEKKQLQKQKMFDGNINTLGLRVEKLEKQVKILLQRLDRLEGKTKPLPLDKKLPPSLNK